MLNNFKFANINAKTKGMYAKFLKSQDYEELSKQESIKEAVVLLKSKIDIEEIDDNDGRREIESKLYHLLLKDIEKIYPLLNKNSKEMLEVYLSKFKVKYHDGQIIQEDELLENEFYQEYFKKVYKKAEQYKDKVLLDLIGKQIDVTNILWTLRTKKYYQTGENKANQYEIQIHYKLSKEVLDELSANLDQAEETMAKTIYQNLNLEDDKIEMEIQNYLYRLYINYFKTQSFSLCMIVAYLELREIQIKNIITIIEGIRYQVDFQTIQKKLIRRIGGIENKWQ